MPGVARCLPCQTAKKSWAYLSPFGRNARTSQTDDRQTTTDRPMAIPTHWLASHESAIAAIEIELSNWKWMWRNLLFPILWLLAQTVQHLFIGLLKVSFGCVTSFTCAFVYKQTVCSKSIYYFIYHSSLCIVRTLQIAICLHTSIHRCGFHYIW